VSVGAMPHEQIMRAIELYGMQVAPLVRRELARRTASGPRPPVPSGQVGVSAR